MEGSNAFAVFGRTPADPLFESVRESESAFKSDIASDDLDLVIGGGEEVHGALESEEGELLAGAAADFLAAEAAEVFVAHAGDGGEFVEGPWAFEIGFDDLPHAPEPFVGDVRAGEAEDVVMDQLGPVMEGGGAASVSGFGVEAFDGGFEGMAIEGTADG